MGKTRRDLVTDSLMLRAHRRRVRRTAGLAVCGLLFVACGDDSDSPSATVAGSGSAATTDGGAEQPSTTAASSPSTTGGADSETAGTTAAPGGEPTGGSPELEAFDPSRPPGPATGLPERVAFANNSSAPFLKAFSDNMQTAVESQGMEFVSAVIEADPVGYVDQINQFLARGVGALVDGPVDPAAQENVHIDAIDAGVGLLTLVASPSIMIGQTDQYAVGYAQGEAAARYITTSLDGNAEVLLFNLDSGGAELQKRTDGVKDGLATAGPGVEIVVDQEAATPEEGSDIASTALQAHPDINVVLGSDWVVVGAYRAFEQGGNLDDDMYFGGIDGDPQAVELISQGGPYRTSHGFAWEILGYAYGQFGVDWINGGSIPRVLLVPPVELTMDSLEQYQADMNRAGEIFADESLLDKYVIRLGNTSFAEKDVFWETDYSPPPGD